MYSEPDQDPDPLLTRIRIHYSGKLDPIRGFRNVVLRIRIRIHVKMRWIRNAAFNTSNKNISFKTILQKRACLTWLRPCWSPWSRSRTPTSALPPSWTGKKALVGLAYLYMRSAFETLLMSECFLEAEHIRFNRPLPATLNPS